MNKLAKKVNSHLSAFFRTFLYSFKIKIQSFTCHLLIDNHNYIPSYLKMIRNFDFILFVPCHRSCIPSCLVVFPTRCYGRTFRKRIPSFFQSYRTFSRSSSFGRQGNPLLYGKKWSCGRGTFESGMVN